MGNYHLMSNLGISINLLPTLLRSTRKEMGRTLHLQQSPPLPERRNYRVRRLRSMVEPWKMILTPNLQYPTRQPLMTQMEK